MDSRLESGVGLEVGVGAVMKQAVGEGAVQGLMEEHEQQCDFHPLVGEAVGVSGAIALEQSMGLHLAQVVAQLIEPVAFGAQAEASRAVLAARRLSRTTGLPRALPP